jgi:hypothetical protein
MVVAIILTAWVIGSAVFCLVLLGAAAKSMPQRDEQTVPENEFHIVPEKELPSNLGASPSRPVRGSRIASSLQG